MGMFGTISGHGPRAGSNRVVSTYLGTVTDASDLSSYSIGSAPLSGIERGHIVAAFVTAKAGSGGINLTSATIDGQSASQIYTFANVEAGGTSRIVFVEAPATSNSTGTVAVNWDTTALRCGVMLWWVKNLKSTTPTDTAGDNGNDPSDTIDVLKGGSVLAAAYSGQDESVFTWTGLTKRDETMFDVRTISPASDDFNSAQSGLSILADASLTGSNFTLLAAVALR